MLNHKLIKLKDVFHELVSMAALKLKKKMSFLQTIISGIMLTIKHTEVLKKEEKAEQPLHVVICK